MKGDAKQVKTAAVAAGQAIENQKLAQIEDMFRRAAKKGATPKEILGLNDAMIEGIYAQAYRLYNTGKYDDAIKLFRLLTSVNPAEPKFLMGLAATFHMQKAYPDAAGVYTVLSAIDPLSPVSFYHASDCYIKMNDIPSAIIALEMAIDRADKPEFKALKDRAILTRDSLKKELQESFKEG